jgi:hypothetical protein
VRGHDRHEDRRDHDQPDHGKDEFDQHALRGPLSVAYPGRLCHSTAAITVVVGPFPLPPPQPDRLGIRNISPQRHSPARTRLLHCRCAASTFPLSRPGGTSSMDRKIMHRAVSLVGWLCAGVLGAWLSWSLVADHWADAPTLSLTLSLGISLLVAWAMGALLVWRHPWASALVFAAAATVPLTSEHALPVPALLTAVSAALAVESLLAGITTWLPPRDSAPSRPAVPSGTLQPAMAPARTCVVCHEPCTDLICAACAAALGPEGDIWRGDDEPPRGRTDHQVQILVSPDLPGAGERARSLPYSLPDGVGPRIASQRHKAVSPR